MQGQGKCRKRELPREKKQVECKRDREGIKAEEYAFRDSTHLNPILPTVA